MMQSDSLPLTEAIDDERVRDVFAKHNVNFGSDPDTIYTPAITLWALVCQALFSAEHRSCKAAVLRVAAYFASVGQIVCGTNTGNYCRARAQIPSEAVREITIQIATHVEATVERDTALSEEEATQKLCPPVIAEVRTQPVGGRLLLVDGFTVTAADTPENQAEYPQNPAQQEGLGFPIIRGVSLISLTTGLLFDCEVGPYSGKESGETALLWKMLDRLQPGDTLIADSYYCTYWLIAACRARDVRIVMKNHHQRDDDPADARRINKHERIVTWKLPQRPEWMSQEVYAEQPASVEIRLVDAQVIEPGFRTQGFTVATTMLDHRQFTRVWISSVYRSRWLVELDIRSIKCSLGMDVIRAKTPAMVRTEIWSCWLAYNLIRAKMLQSAAANSRDPRSLSFTTTMQMLGVSWLICAVLGVTSELAQLGQEASSSEVVGNRPDRVEPRVNKRRPKVLALMTKPRAQYHAELGVAS